MSSGGGLIRVAEQVFDNFFSDDFRGILFLCELSLDPLELFHHVLPKVRVVQQTSRFSGNPLGFETRLDQLRNDRGVGEDVDD